MTELEPPKRKYKLALWFVLLFIFLPLFTGGVAIVVSLRADVAAEKERQVQEHIKSVCWAVTSSMEGCILELQAISADTENSIPWGSPHPYIEINKDGYYFGYSDMIIERFGADSRTTIYNQNYDRIRAEVVIQLQKYRDTATTDEERPEYDRLIDMLEADE